MIYLVKYKYGNPYHIGTRTKTVIVLADTQREALDYVQESDTDFNELLQCLPYAGKGQVICLQET